MNSWLAAERMSVNPRNAPSTTFCPEPSPPPTGLFLKQVWRMNLWRHIWKIQEKWKFMQGFFFFFYALPIIVQWTWSEKLVTISFLLKWTLLPFLLSVWKAGMPFPWWGILAPPCGIQPEFRGSRLHPCRGPRRDAQVHVALLPHRTVHISGEKQSGRRWGGKQIFGLFFFFLSSDHASVLKISPVHFQILSSLLSSVVIW